MVFIVLNTLFAICFFQTFTTIPLYFKQDLLMKENQIGIIMAINGLLIGILEMVIVHKLESKGGILSNVIRGVFWWPWHLQRSISYPACSRWQWCSSYSLPLAKW